jgi:curved DNA-binding protein CbpA
VLKDYYDILDLAPSASLTEIKKAYRRLAHQSHPDKHPGDAYAAARFAEIKEAYEVLTNPGKKESWLQQRWYQQSLGRKEKEKTITPVNWLQLALELERHVRQLDHFRMDHNGLRDYHLQLLDTETIRILRGFAEPETSRQLIETFLRTLEPLSRSQAAPVLTQLRLLAGSDETLLEKINGFHRQLHHRHRAEKSQPWIILVVTLGLCLLIWRMGR